MLTSPRPTEILGCVVTSRPDFGAGMTVYTYDHKTAELLRKCIVMGEGLQFSSAMQKHLSVGRKYGNTH